MTFYKEIDWAAKVGGTVQAVQAGSLAEEIGLQPGDELLAVNGNEVEDVIDVQFYAAEEELELLVKRGEEYLLFEASRDYQQMLGLSFTHPTFDTDIRRCNNLCEFCFVLQMAPKFRRTLYIKDDDYRYSFLFGHYVTLTNLSDHDWWRIETMGLSPLYVSVHVTEQTLRRKFLRNQDAPDIMTQLRWLADRGIQVHTQLVIVPEFNDGAWLDQSLEQLAELWPAVRSVSVVPVGLTRHHKYGMRTHTQEEALQMLDYVFEAQQRFQRALGLRFVYATDEWFLVAGRPVPKADAYDEQPLRENGLGMVRYFLDEWQALQEEIAGWKSDRRGQQPRRQFNRVRLVSGALFSPVLAEVAVSLSEVTGVSFEVQAIRNERLGESITVAGLLMAEDVLAQLPDPLTEELVVLPRIMFDHPDRVSLDDVSPQEIATRVGRPVALADLTGDIWDAVLGRSEAMFFPI